MPGIRYSVEKNFEHSQLERNFSCTCTDFSMRQLPCKHVYAVILRYFSSPSKNIELSCQKWQQIQQPQQQVPTPEELIHNIHEMTQNLNDLDVNSLQVVCNQLSRVLEDVRRPNRTFQEGD
ncbi:17885_t:CDS:1 [Cetraspora pellucida]|uniref:17885_t:CDS:1 n=1 Tax=Cetraspora pellucida TaxID=1433469 RepID=A0ACA9L928_9GLOM|nr:17885_t:CDS:1 [Cetraspora pellucida]